MKSAHSCRVCSRWLEGEWNRSGDDAERAALQAMMDRGYCDKPGCVAEAERRAGAMKPATDIEDMVWFLRDRYDEIELVAQRAVNDPAVRGIEYEHQYGRLSVPAAWLLADMDAKRALLDEAIKYQPGQRGYGMAAQACKLLATMFDTHEDYSEAWRP